MLSYIIFSITEQMGDLGSGRVCATSQELKALYVARAKASQARKSAFPGGPCAPASEFSATYGIGVGLYLKLLVW
jgi:hypothetical protein